MMLKCLRAEEQDRHADEQADVAGSGGEERLEGGVGVRVLLPPVPDQHERAEAHELPAEEHLDRVHGRDQGEHPAGEQAERREEVGEAAVAAHVLEREDVHEQRDDRDHTSIATTRPSTCVPIGHFTPPMSNQFTDLMIGATTRCCDSPSARGAITERPKAENSRSFRARLASSTCWIHWNAVQIDRTNDAPIAAMPISEPLQGIRLPKRMISQNGGRDERDEPRVLHEPHGSALHGVELVRAMLRRFR